MKSSQSLHQQQVVVVQNEPLGLKSKLDYQPNCLSTMKKGDRQFLEDYQRSAPIMELPMLPLSSDNSCLGEKLRLVEVNNSYRNKMSKKTSDESSPISVIDGILEVISYDYKIDSEDEDDEEVMVLPVKVDNYVNKRSRLSKADRRRKELLLDNALAITDALRVIEEDKNMAELFRSSGDEESLDSGDIDEGYDSDAL